MRVRKSAIGSVIDMRLPTRLGHARDVAVVRQLAQAQAAEPELPVHRARAPAATTTRVRARLVLRGPLRGDDLGCLGHVSLSYAATGSPSVSNAPGRPSRAKGMPSASSSVNASASVWAVVVIATSRPRTWSTLS